MVILLLRRSLIIRRVLKYCHYMQIFLRQGNTSRRKILYINPLVHDNISKHRISMKLLTQVKGQNTTHFFSWRFLILSTHSGVIGHCSILHNLKNPLKACSIEFDTCSNKMTPKDHLAASTTWKCWSLKALSNEHYPSPVGLLITSTESQKCWK